MPRYYFHLRNDLDVRDEEGQERPDALAARAKALQYAREMAAVSVVEQGKVDLSHFIEVQDGSCAVIASVTFGDALTILNAPGMAKGPGSP